jgi:hypothetical protein
VTAAEPRQAQQPAAGRVPLRPLTLVEDGPGVLVGDPAAGTFVAIPPVGAVVIRALQAGATVDQAAAEVYRQAGEPVDVLSFVDALRELGFLGTEDPAEPARTAPVEPARTAPVQQRRWLPEVAASPARRLFGRVAWGCYAAAALFCVGCLLLRPQLWTRPAVVGRDGLVVIPAVLLTYLFTALREVWHWLAARALGLSARFGVDRRLCFLVFETDLSQLWTVPRRRRYGPQLAGLAIDSVGLAGLLALRLGWRELSPTAAGVLDAVIYLKITTMIWQCLAFLRTDLYGVLVTAAGCRNLWQVKSLLLRAAFGRLSVQQAAELAAADARDLRVGRWFRWVYLAGILAAVGYIGYFFLPAMMSLAH